MDLDPFEIELHQQWPPGDWRDLTVLVGVSGGADSVALLRGLVSLRPAGAGKLIVAHLNHGLRGAQSDGDEQWVCKLAENLALECVVERTNLQAASQPDGLEAAARDARYAFFQAAAEQFGARYVALAHTRDDQVETVLHRMVRGTGIAGLAGMPRARGLSDSVTLIRPLLETARSAVREYLERLGQPWREDASNLDLNFTRNRLRHELLPLLAEKFNPKADEALLRLARLAGEAQAVLEGQVAQLMERAVCSAAPDEVVLALPALGKTPPYLVRELLVRIWREQNWPRQNMSLAHWEELADLALEEGRGGASNCQQRIFPGEIRIRLEGELLAMKRDQTVKNIP